MNWEKLCAGVFWSDPSLDRGEITRHDTTTLRRLEWTPHLENTTVSTVLKSLLRMSLSSWLARFPTDWWIPSCRGRINK